MSSSLRTLLLGPAVFVLLLATQPVVATERVDLEAAWLRSDPEIANGRDDLASASDALASFRAQRAGGWSLESGKTSVSGDRSGVSGAELTPSARLDLGKDTSLEAATLYSWSPPREGAVATGSGGSALTGKLGLAWDAIRYEPARDAELRSLERHRDRTEDVLTRLVGESRLRFYSEIEATLRLASDLAEAETALLKAQGALTQAVVVQGVLKNSLRWRALYLETVRSTDAALVAKQQADTALDRLGTRCGLSLSWDALEEWLASKPRADLRNDQGRGEPYEVRQSRRDLSSAVSASQDGDPLLLRFRGGTMPSTSWSSSTEPTASLGGWSGVEFSTKALDLESGLEIDGRGNWRVSGSVTFKPEPSEVSRLRRAELDRAVARAARTVEADRLNAARAAQEAALQWAQAEGALERSQQAFLLSQENEEVAADAHSRGIIGAEELQGFRASSQSARLARNRALALYHKATVALEMTRGPQ